MPDRIRQGVAAMRTLFGRGSYRDELQALIARYARASFYTKPEPVLRRLQRQIVRVLARKYFPQARQVGIESARPVAEALQGRRLTDRELRLRGQIRRRLELESRLNLRAFEAALEAEVESMPPQIRAAFLRARRDGLARRQLIRDLVQADQAELQSLAQAYKRLDAAEERLARAERRLARAPKGKRHQPAAEVREARKEVRRAKASLRGRRSLLARFTVAVQGHARDAIRREAQAAQQAVFEQLGYRQLQWVAVNGADACPYCERQHGKVRTARQWRGKGPGESAEQAQYCGSACMCVLVPVEYAAGNPGLARPIQAAA